MRAIALIPARAGSKRVPDKNIRRLGEHPVLAYSIAAARESGVFSSVLVSTDSEHYARVAAHYEAETPFLRPAELAGDLSPDIEWVEHALVELKRQGREFDCFSILRPTSPFRTAATIRRAWETFCADPAADSLRAVEKCQQHPGKMWVIRGQRMLPLMPLGPEKQPWHSTPYQDLPAIYVQNASLEIAKTSVVFHGRTIAGQVIVPFLTSGFEGFDINQPREWQHAETLLAKGEAVLPAVPQSPYQDPK